MKVFECGSRIKTSLSVIPAIITAISIRFNAVAYEVSYFNNGEYKQIYLNETEFTLEDGKKQTIGFKNNHS